MALPKRKASRLPEYDYSTPGAYFVTICTHNRQCILSDIIVGADAPGGPQPRLTDKKTEDGETAVVSPPSFFFTPARPTSGRRTAGSVP